MTKTYYGPNNSTSDQYRLSPAPQISINTEPYYAGDAIIGYTYTVSLRGYASSYRKLNSTDPKYSINSIGLVVDSIATVKSILSRNGSNLSIREDTGTETIKCKGGILRSLSFNESPNNWMGYAEYTAQIEFNEIELINGSSLQSIACSDSYLDSLSKSNNIVDISKYKIKSYTDNWSINIEDSLYNRIQSNFDIDNSSLNVTYTISATGKNHYINNNLIPAWEQAKNFAQERLFNKVSTMLSSTLGITADTACDATNSLNQIGSSTNGLFSNLDAKYNVYNETLSCSTSESDGSFSVTYNAIIKKDSPSTSVIAHSASRHTFTKTFNVQNDNTRINTITVQGTIEGLVPGGIITAIGSGFQLPASGSILVSTGVSNKYSQALTALGKISNSYTDLNDIFKQKLGIKYINLGLTSQISGCSPPAYPIPSSFNLTHNYHEGTITYSAEYASNLICGQVGSFASVSISSESPTPVLAELPIPYTGVLLIQDMNTSTAKKVSITIEGRGTRGCCLSQSSLASRIADASFSVPSGVVLPDMSAYILTQQQRTDNPLDGSYSISLAYTCSVGCS